MALIFTNLPDLDKNAPIVEPQTGRITPYFQRLWQNIKTATVAGAGAAVDISGKVDKNLSGGWTASTGTSSKIAFATYTAPVAAGAYSQVQMQALMDHVQILSQQLKAAKDGLLTSSVFSA